ncbi:MAG: hypothetical protein KDG55_03395 [Rhodocyclaceae bacterium]|nr:hypothetical protein [Rhodocyclaceae bacterium]
MSPAGPESDRIDLRRHAARRADTLLVMLAGAYDPPARFLEHGLPEACAAAGLTADLTLLRTDLSAVADGRIVHELHARVIEPARRDGYGHLILGGISIGAMMALLHQDVFPDSADELLAIATYPGNRALTATIARAGGIRAWRPEALAADEGELRAWRSAKRLGEHPSVPLWFGFGAQDRFATSQQMMAATLPPQRVSALPGAHDWPTWAAVWRWWLAARSGAP